MKLLLTCLLAMLWSANNLPAQENKPFKQLHVGDQVPDLPLNALFSPVSKIQLSQYRGKLVILDFWSSTCMGCIQLFPYMDSIQEQFKDDLQIILVNCHTKQAGDDETKIRKIIDRVQTRIGQQIDIPVIADNPWLDEAFPRKFIPHEVWLDTNGVVISITDAQQVTRNNIKACLEGKVPVMPQKTDLFDFDPDRPLYVNGNGGSGDNFLARSLFTPSIEGIGHVVSQYCDSNNCRLTMYNRRLSNFIQTAYPIEMSVPESQQEWKFKGNRNLADAGNSPDPDNSYYCYELIFPAVGNPFEREKAMHRYLRQDLERAFGLSVKVVRKEVDCWLLTTTSSIRKTYTKGGETTSDLNPSSKRKYLHNEPVEMVTRLLTNQLLLPVIDETRLTTNIDLELPDNLDDKDAILKCFREAGFRLQKIKRTLPITVITMN